MLCFRESKIIILLLLEQASFLVNFSIASRYKYVNLFLLQGGISLN